MRYLSFLIAATALTVSGVAGAQTSYFGTDDGSAVGGAMPNSDAAAADFLGAASGYGTVSTINFDNLPTSDSNVYDLNGVTITTTNPLLGNGFSGISDTNLGNLYGYDQSAGGSGKWFGFPAGTATFTFDGPTNSVGFYISGTQTTFGDLFNVTIDGMTYQAPINVNGGAGFFGFTSDTAFSSVTIDRPGGDAWGIDNFSFNAAAVPEPATWALMIGGFGMVGGAMRRRSTVRFARA